MGVERDETVARGLEHARERFARLSALAAPSDQLRDERAHPEYMAVAWASAFDAASASRASSRVMRS